MKNQPSQEIQYYPKEALILSDDVTGARQWAVALKNTMLTYFEIDPNCTFICHSHESEQITMVLEGVLYFEHGEKVFEVKAGETIAIPSNVPHSAYTMAAAVKAVDAWSPVMNKYQN